MSNKARLIAFLNTGLRTGIEGSHWATLYQHSKLDRMSAGFEIRISEFNS